MKINNKCLNAFLMAFWGIVASCSAPREQLDGKPQAAFIETAHISFKDPLLRLYLLNWVFERSSGPISFDEAAREPVVRLPYLRKYGPIIDLSGLEYFKALEVLDAPYHNMECVDLSLHAQLSKISLYGNSRLIKAVLPNNPAKLNYIDMRCCNALKSVNFFQAHSLQTLILDGCKNYEGPLDVSKMPRLEFLSLNGVPITYLDFRNSPNLARADLRGMPRSLRVCITPEQSLQLQTAEQTGWQYDEDGVEWLVN